MANEIQVAHTTSGLTLYAIIRNTAGDVYKSTASTWQPYNSGDVALYAVSLTEQTSSGYYVGNIVVPSSGNGPETIHATVYEQLGGSPANTDTLVDHQVFEWDGSAVINLRTLVGLLPSALVGGKIDANVSKWAGEDVSVNGDDLPIVVAAKVYDQVDDAYYALSVASTGEFRSAEVTSINTKIGTPSTTVSNDIAAVLELSIGSFALMSQAATVNASFAGIVSLLPTSLTVDGLMPCDVLRIAGDDDAATQQARAANAIYSGSVTGTSSATTVVDSNLTINPGRGVLIWRTGSLAGRRCPIASTSGTTITVNESMGGTPASGDEYDIF